MAHDLIASLGHQVLQKAAAEHFTHFQRQMHPVVSSENYINAVHMRAISAALQKVAAREINRVLIAVPPRHFKSYLASVAFPTYLLGLDPSLKIICASYGSELADNFASQSRDILKSPLYQAVFPHTKLTTKQPPLHKLRTTQNGYRYATSIGGPLTGVGADVVVIDDPMKAVDASSDIMRDNVGDWFKQSLMTRFDKPAEARIVVLMQRLHQDDLIGRLKAEEGWTVLELPGVARVTQSLDLGFGKTTALKPGQILFPERFDQKTLDQLRHDLGDAGYAAQILQRPTPAGGHLFNLGKARRYKATMAEAVKQVEATIVSVDCAAAVSLSSDYTAITTWGVKGKAVYLLHAVRGRWTLTQLIKVLQPIIHAANAKKRAVLIENGGSGIPLAHMLTQSGLQGVWTWHPKNGKEARADMANLRMEQGLLRLPEKAPWLEEVEAELAAFPHGKNDDYVDSMSQVIWNLEANWVMTLDLSSYPSHAHA